jgi:hypothetical protein
MRNVTHFLDCDSFLGSGSGLIAESNRKNGTPTQPFSIITHTRPDLRVHSLTPHWYAVSAEHIALDSSAVAAKTVPADKWVAFGCSDPVVDGLSHILV